MKKFSYDRILFSIVVCLGVALSLHLITQLEAPALGEKATSGEAVDEVIRINFDPSPDGKGEPEQSAPGGTRGQCKQDENPPIPPLTLLIPASSQVLTIAEHPTFFVYVPQTAGQTAEFVLKEEINQNEAKVIYQQNFPLAGTAGIVSLKLPDNTTKLEIGKKYQWSFSIICNPEDRQGDSIVYATIKRIELSLNLEKYLKNKTPLERAVIYAKNGIWQETITTLAELRRSQPDNSSLQIMWEELLKSESVKLEEISEKPLIECCQPQESDTKTPIQ